ncbi:hypothetical protein KSP39_PZI010909 [Platanthera zijinensis]|uniref:Reverse transcriptase domain-containing protein n=1 Tax=Platanthera zijinensis TaxID=2320716 RepID=A0AAP0BIH7_9ASPA
MSTKSTRRASSVVLFFALALLTTFTANTTAAAGAAARLLHDQAQGSEPVDAVKNGFLGRFVLMESPQANGHPGPSILPATMVTRSEAETARLATLEKNYVGLADSVTAMEGRLNTSTKNMEERMDGRMEEIKALLMQSLKGKAVQGSDSEAEAPQNARSTGNGGSAGSGHFGPDGIGTDPGRTEPAGTGSAPAWMGAPHAYHGWSTVADGTGGSRPGGTYAARQPAAWAGQPTPHPGVPTGNGAGGPSAAQEGVGADPWRNREAPAAPLRPPGAVDANFGGRTGLLPTPQHMGGPMRFGNCETWAEQPRRQGFHGGGQQWGGGQGGANFHDPFGRPQHGPEFNGRHGDMQQRPYMPPKRTRMNFPKFRGGDALEWVQKAELFFTYQEIPNDQWVQLASFHLEEDAYQWAQWFIRAHGYATWANFVEGFVARFGPLEYEDVEPTLQKLRQKGTVMEYRADFEKLANRVNWEEKTLLSCFISGLRDHLRDEVHAYMPRSLSHAISLARIQEERFNRQRTRAPPRAPPAPATGRREQAPTARPTVTRLTWPELQARKEKGLCFNCDEKYAPGHRCQKVQVFMLREEDEEDHLGLEAEEELDLAEFGVSIQAMEGCVAPTTMRIKGRIGKERVTILIDSGSTHNFINPEVALKTRHPVDRNAAFQVMVADGSKLRCEGALKGVEIQLTGYVCRTDVYLLPIKGSDMVLGVQWLRQLRRVTTDWDRMTLEFTQQGTDYCLHGIRSSPLKEISLRSLQRLEEQGSMMAVILGMAAEGADTQRAPDPIQFLLAQYEDVFQEPHTLPPSRFRDHQIQLKAGTDPTNIRPYRYPYVQKAEIERSVREMLATGIIRPSTSAFSSPIILVKKKDGSWRFCVDYRGLNSSTIKDKFPIPMIEELLDELHGASLFTKLDLRSGYHQIRMKEEDVHKTAFRTHDGHYEFLVMPFGLANAPSTFQAVMNEIFRPLLRRYVLVFFDDILIYSRTWDDHLEHVRHVLTILRENQLFAKKSKCSFGKSQVEYLGHLVSARGVQADPQKIESMVSWPQPTTVRALRGFLGLTGYYRRFVKDYGKIARPLTQLLQKDAFQWSIEADEAFRALKQAMTTTPVLALPDFSKEFVVETDASGVGLGAVLMQEGRPLAYSARLWPHGRWGFRRTRRRCWQLYMQSRCGDPISWASTSRSKWLTKLMGYDYEIVYKQGRENVVADALSRLPESSLSHVSGPVVTTLDEIQAAVLQDPELRTIIETLQQGQATEPGYHLQGQRLYFQGRVVIPSASPWRTAMMQEFHASPTGGHAGILRTLQRLRANVFWKGMRRDVQQFVRECDICQRQKYETTSPAGLLTPLEIPHQVWDTISMDFIDGLPKSQGKSVILVGGRQAFQVWSFPSVEPSVHGGDSRRVICARDCAPPWPPTLHHFRQGPGLYQQFLAGAFSTPGHDTAHEHRPPSPDGRTD